MLRQIGEALYHGEPPPTLYHYTSFRGLMGIVASHSLWASEIRYMNDSAEMRHTINLMVGAIGNRLQSRPDYAAFYQPMLEWLHHRLGNDHFVFAASFRAHGNLLSQWRGYADNGGGVSIEFDAQGFRQYSGEDSPFGLTRLWRVVYNDMSQRNVVRKAIDYPYWPSQAQPDCVRYIADALSFFLPTFKNVDFIDEKERRLIFTPDPVKPPKPRFRVRAGMLVPYMRMRDMAGLPPEAPPRPLPIVRVLVGPGRHRLLNRESLRMALDAQGYGTVPVDVSSTPYRG